MKKARKWGLVVTREAIDDFAKLSAKERLEWLDDMRLWLSKVKPIRSKVKE